MARKGYFRAIVLEVLNLKLESISTVSCRNRCTPNIHLTRGNRSPSWQVLFVCSCEDIRFESSSDRGWTVQIFYEVVAFADVPGAGSLLASPL